MPGHRLLGHRCLSTVIVVAVEATGDALDQIAGGCLSDAEPMRRRVV
jgi:hypothetical protein